MMKSESEVALGQDTVQVYLRAYGSTYQTGAGFGHRYEPIEDESDREGRRESRIAWQKALSVTALFILFGFAASGASVRWADGGRKPPDGEHSGRPSYRSMFEVSTQLLYVISRPGRCVRVGRLGVVATFDRYVPVLNCCST